MLLLGLSACESTPPEEALRKTIATMQAEGEQHHVSAVMASVAEDFRGPGGSDRRELQRLLTFASMQNQNLGVTVGPIDVQLMGDRATAKFTLGVTGGSGRYLPDQAQVYDVQTGWRLEGADWMLISADWKERL